MPASIANPVRVEIFNQRLLAITEEMGAQLVRSAFSPNIKERRDCSVALFDIEGRCVAQAAHIPIHLGSLLGGIEALLKAFPSATMRPGDAFICNDAYLAGGTHLPDISIIKPVFHDGLARFFTACVGHHADVGGAVPGSISPNASSIFEEGIRIPPLRFARDDHIDQGLMSLIVNNTREPEERVLDLQVQLATCSAGAEKFAALVEREGLEATLRDIDDLYTYTQRRLASQIEKVPDGEYRGETAMDDDGTGGAEVPIVATVRIKGSALEFDFTGTGAQSAGSFNVMPSGVQATIAYAVKALLDPDLAPNSGLFEALKLTVPEGCILNPRFPAAVGARTTTCQKLAGAIFDAFTACLPAEQIMAGSHDVLAAMVFSGKRRPKTAIEPTPMDGANAYSSPHPEQSRTYVYLETVGGGIGARGCADGADGAHVHITNSLNMPVEAVELEYPLLVERYELLQDSGGAGEFRGGQGIARQVRVLDDGTSFASRADGFQTAAKGVGGGLPPGPCRVIFSPGGKDERVLDPKQRLLSLSAGEVIRLETPGGAGLGSPAARPLESLAEDLRDARISWQRAVAVYGQQRCDLALQHLDSDIVQSICNAHLEVTSSND